MMLIDICSYADYADWNVHHDIFSPDTAHVYVLFALFTYRLCGIDFAV